MKNKSDEFDLNLNELNKEFRPASDNIDDLQNPDELQHMLIDNTREIFARNSSDFPVYTKEEAIKKFGRVYLAPTGCIGVETEEGNRFIPVCVNLEIDPSFEEIFDFYFTLWIRRNNRDLVKPFLIHHYYYSFPNNKDKYRDFLLDILNGSEGIALEDVRKERRITEFIDGELKELKPLSFNFNGRRGCDLEKEFKDVFNSLFKKEIIKTDFETLYKALFDTDKSKSFKKIVWFGGMHVLNRFITYLGNSEYTKGKRIPHFLIASTLFKHHKDGEFTSKKLRESHKKTREDIPEHLEVLIKSFRIGT